MDLHIAVLGKENTDILCRYLCREAIFQIIEVSNHTKKKHHHHVWQSKNLNSLGDKNRIWPRSDFIVKIKVRAGSLCKRLSRFNDRRLGCVY